MDEESKPSSNSRRPILIRGKSLPTFHSRSDADHTQLPRYSRSDADHAQLPRYSRSDADHVQLPRYRSLRHTKKIHPPNPEILIIPNDLNNKMAIPNVEIDCLPKHQYKSEEPSTSQNLSYEPIQTVSPWSAILDQIVALPENGERDPELLESLDLRLRFAVDLALADLDSGDGSIGSDFPYLDPEVDFNHMMHPLDANFRRGVKKTEICQVCYEERSLWERPCCQITVCDSCLSTYIQTEIEDNGHISIECVGQSCSTPLTVDEITLLMKDDELRQKYARYKQNANCQPNQKTCPHCCFLTEVDPRDLENKHIKKYGKRVECPQCSYVWCYSCHAPAHPEIKCKKAQQGSKALKQWAKEYGCGQKNARRCPGCKVFIQRNKGCDHMTCKKCNTQFCYKCGNRHRNVKFLGSHYDRFSIFGCSYNLFNGRRKHLRRFIRGSIFAAKLLAIPVALSLAVAALPIAVVIVILGGPVYGVVRYIRYRNQRRALRDSRAITERARRLRALEDMEHSGFPPGFYIQLEPRNAVNY